MDSTYLNLLVKDAHMVFCFFNISEDIKNNLIQDSKINSEINYPVIKLFYIVDGVTVERAVIFPDKLANNWYINVPDEDQDLFVTLGILYKDEFIPAITSNTVTTPRENPSRDDSVYFIDIASTDSKAIIKHSSIPLLLLNDSRAKKLHKNPFVQEHIHQIIKKKLSSS